jgi:hypothetical protein
MPTGRLARSDGQALFGPCRSALNLSSPWQKLPAVSQGVASEPGAVSPDAKTREPRPPSILEHRSRART